MNAFCRPGPEKTPTNVLSRQAPCSSRIWPAEGGECQLWATLKTQPVWGHELILVAPAGLPQNARAKKSQVSFQVFGVTAPLPTPGKIQDQS